MPQSGTKLAVLISPSDLQPLHFPPACHKARVPSLAQKLHTTTCAPSLESLLWHSTWENGPGYGGIELCFPLQLLPTHRSSPLPVALSSLLNHLAKYQLPNPQMCTDTQTALQVRSCACSLHQQCSWSRGKSRSILKYNTMC